MNKYLYRRLVWFSAALVLMLAGSAFGNNGFVASKSSTTKKQISNPVSSKAEKLIDYQNQSFRIINNASTTMADTVLHWDGPNSSGVGDGITQWRGIVVFTPTELNPFVGTHEISEVWAWMRSPLAWDSVLVEVYEGVTINPVGPSTIDLGTMVYSQDITAEITTLDDWTVHTLTAPVPIQNGEIYAAVIFVEQNQASPPAYPLGTDAGPMVAERGGWVWDPTLPNGAQLADFGINFNWNIRMGLSATGGGMNVVNDGGFEMGAGSGAWNEFSSNFGTPLCDIPSCGTGGGTGPHTGDWWCWFGGTSSAETGSVDQDVTIPSGTANLSFYLEIPSGGNQGFMKVIIDSDTLMTVTEADTQTYAIYSQVNMDVSAYADGGIHNLKFFSVTDAGSGVTNFFVDDISLDVVTGIGDPITNTPTDFVLKQNYPNPFNPSTTIVYQLASNANVVLKIYNLTGQEIKALVNERQSAGSQQVVWDGRDYNGHQVASGIYLYRLRAGDLTQTKKMTLLR